MFRNNNQSWIPIFSCSLLSGIAIFISLCLILSLIPLYLNNRSVEKSSTIYQVYTVNNVSFTIGSSTTRQIRATDSTSYEPTSAMIDSIAKELNKLCSQIDAHCVVTVATMSSKTKLICTLKIYFRRGCFACQKAEKKLIKKLLKKSLILSIYTEYYQNCIFNPITSGTTVITLDDDIDDDKIPRPKETLIKTLVQQTNICGTSLGYPTGCNRTDASGTIMKTFLGNTIGAVEYDCYYFLPLTSATHIKVEFVFQSDSTNDDVIVIDDVTLSSTVNLITNGDFQTVAVVPDRNKQTLGSPWTVSSCGNCQALVGSFDQSSNVIFAAIGSSVILSQTVAINTVGQQFLYTLGFSLQYGCASTCSMSVKLTTT